MKALLSIVPIALCLGLGCAPLPGEEGYEAWPEDLSVEEIEQSLREADAEDKPMRGAGFGSSTFGLVDKPRLGGGLSSSTVNAKGEEEEDKGVVSQDCRRPDANC